MFEVRVVLYGSQTVKSDFLCAVMFEVRVVLDGSQTLGEQMQHGIFGYPPINVKYSDRKRYYEMFDCYYRNNDQNPAISLVVEKIKEHFANLNSCLFTE